MFQHKLHNIVIHECTSMSLSLQFSGQHTFLFSFKNARMSNDLHIRLRLPVVIRPHTEKILSTNACEAGAARRSSASGASRLYEDLLAAQKPSASSIIHSSNSAM